MLKRFVRDESGVALGLAIIMVVLIGVMGAGLLVFVNTDLQNVVEVNGGQRAFNAADAGVQAAKRQLLSDAVPEHYGSGTDSSKNIDWSYKKTDGIAKKYTDMKSLSFNGQTIKVSIQYLPPVTAPATPNKDQAPETMPDGDTKLASGCRYFKVTSYGESSDAKRGVEATYCASQLDVPTAYYTPKDIEFNGNVHVSGVSFFARGNIKGSTSGSVSIDRMTPALYGDWDTTKFKPQSNRNTKARVNASNQPVTGAGLAAEGKVCGNNACTTSAADNVHDYDSTTATKFCRKPAPTPSLPCSTTVAGGEPNPSGTISYPFDPNAIPNLQLLKEEAQRQGRYFSTRTDIDNAQYQPATSKGAQTVIFVDAGGNTANVDYRVNTTPKAQGTIVVKNGNFKISNSSNGFKGIVIVTGDGVNTGKYSNVGSDTVEGFVIASGTMEIGGGVAPFSATDNFTDRPGFYGVKLWSWRELYQ